MMFNSAGGWAYHRKALKHAKIGWARFRGQMKDAISEWLLTIPSDTKTLILIGPSGGYCLPIRELKKYNLVIVDPDPLAQRILNFRIYKKINLGNESERVTKDLIIEPVLQPAYTETLAELFAKHAGAPVLFCNFWGQVGTLTPKSDQVLKYWKTNLPPLLRNRAWFSFHDRISTTDLMPIEHDKNVGSNYQPNFRLTEMFFHKSAGTVIDHKTERFFDFQSVKGYLLWPMNKKTFHVIEICSS